MRVVCSPFQVTGVRSNQYNRGPLAPYMTSSMLMDAANQLGSNVKATMAAAQRLFEGDFEGALGNSGHSVPLCCSACEALLCFHLNKQSACFMRRVITLFCAAKQQPLSTSSWLKFWHLVQDPVKASTAKAAQLNSFHRAVCCCLHLAVLHMVAIQSTHDSFCLLIY